jgi:hypothetical protein
MPIASVFDEQDLRRFVLRTGGSQVASIAGREAGVT